MTQSCKVHEIKINSIGGWILEVVSLGFGWPRFSVEVAYLREDRDFVFILFGALDC